jgi:hypothetical protein
LFTENRFRLRALALPAAILSLALVTGCGDDDDDSGDGGGDAQALTITVADDGKSKSTVKAPATTEAGVAELTLENTGKRPHDAQLFRVEGNKTATQVIAAVGKLLQGQGGTPDWLSAAGGVGATGPGQSATVTQVLEPGTYYIGDIEGTSGPPDPKSVPKLVVSGEASDAELPETDAAVTATEYKFAAEGLTAGQNEILFDNAGAEPHHIIAAPINPGSTIEDVRAFVKTEKGKPPVDEANAPVTAVLEGQMSQIVTMYLAKPGSYALLCFISDRKGGPPHALKGMISEATVEG